VLSVTRHGNKLKLGHLAGNRFVIRLRKIQMPIPEAAKAAEKILAVLSSRGVPNYFGPQRFGNRSTGHLLGQAIARDKIDDFVDIFLGQPEGDDFLSEARSFYDKGEYEKAYGATPYSFSNERRAIKALIKSKGQKKKAFGAIDKRLKSFFISAYQSDIFNRVLAARMPNIDKLLTGDMAYKHVNGACFRVEDAAKEQPRCDSFEISPTGPILGHRTTLLTGSAGEIENAVIDRMQPAEDGLRRMQRYGAKGGRRPLRFKLNNLSLDTGEDSLGPYLELRFELDSGCYATTLLREITKSDL
jgi:tRNA pseudouridine13 synthase